jgi:hypothetical protein
MKKIIFVFLVGLLALSSCKKDKDGPNYLPVQWLDGKWLDGSTFYEFQTSKVEFDADLDEVEVGEVKHEFEENNPIPGLPDLRWREEGDIILKPELVSKTYVEGFFDYKTKKLLVQGVGTVGNAKKTNCRIHYVSPGEIKINGNSFFKE